MDDASHSRPQTKTATGLHVCPECGSGLVQPTRWEQADERGHWRLWRRCPECEWSSDGVHGEREIDAFDEAARPRHRGWPTTASARAREHGSSGRRLRRRPRRGPDHRRRLPPERLSCSAGRRRRRPARAAGAARARSRRPSSARLAAATISSARARTVSSAPVAAIRSQSASAAAASSAAQVDCARAPGRARAATISGRVTVPSSRSVPRALPVRSGGPVTSRTSSSSWKARPISAPKSRSALVVAAEQAGALEQRRGLQPAALEVALLGDRECRRRPGAGRARRGRARPRRGEQLDRARVAGRRRAGRRRARRAGRRWRSRAARPEVAATVGRPRRSGASSRTSSWTRVAMWTSSIAVAARTAAAPPPRPGAEQDQHRPQPLAAGREGRAGVRAERLAVAGDRLAQQLLDLAEPRRQPAAARRRGPPSPAAARPSGRVTRATPLWIAMIPPARTV